ncbi:hypothetical protein OROGR_014255 [Orobanche gracilis]
MAKALRISSIFLISIFSILIIFASDHQGSNQVSAQDDIIVIGTGCYIVDFGYAYQGGPILTAGPDCTVDNCNGIFTDQTTVNIFQGVDSGNAYDYCCCLTE